MHNLDDKIQIKKARIDQRELDKQHDEYYKFIMSSRQGRAWFWRILEDLGIFTSPLAGSNELTFHNIGKQDVGRGLLANIMRLSPDEFVLAMKEANNDRYAREQQYADGNQTGDADDSSE